jgi:hypothetical protein
VHLRAAPTPAAYGRVLRQMPSTRQITRLLVAIACLVAGTFVYAQTVTLDPRTAEFDPSLDHADPTLVVRYDLELYFVGASQPFQVVSLGKPAPQGDGKIRVDLATVLGTFPPAGTNYEARVSAVSGANQFGRSTVSNQFAFSPPCTVSISPTSSSVGGGAVNGSVAVTSGCAWTATSSASWITITSGASGSGNGSVAYSVAANPSTTPRSGSITIGGQTFTITQAGACAFSINPTSASWSASAATSSVAVTATAGCSWTTANPAPWITISGSGSGTGNGTVNYSVATNTSTSARNATLSIAGRTFTVSQAGIVCSPALSATQITVGASGGPGSVGVTVSAGCPWTASSSAAWISITAGTPGNGNGTVSYTVAANGSTANRTGTLTVAGQTYTVTQQGVTCTFSISPTSGSVPASSSTGNVSVTAPNGCAWTAVSGAGWIAVTAGANGSGNGTVAYSVGANPTTTPRSGSIAIAGQTFTISQPGAPCTFGISPTSTSAPAGASTGSIAVTVASGCPWTAVSNAPWITVTSGASGSANGTVNYSMAANPAGTGRSGTITVAGQTFTVTQSGVACTSSISPTGSSVAAAATSGTVTVNIPAGCSWTAVSDAAWITVTAGASGSGGGTVSYSVAANATITGRSGTITIAGQTFTVTQAGVPCSYGLSPATDAVPATGDNRTIGVTAQNGCAWTASPSVSWITITAGASGSGNGTISYTVAANPSTTGRTGTIAAGGQVVTITQPGAPCTFGITPGSVSVDAAAATGTVAVATQASCGWTATSNASWITVTAGVAGTGTGTVAYSIAANPTITERTGTVAIAGRTFTVTQPGVPCTFTIAPTGASVAAGATSGTVAVTAAAAGCTWTASSNASWATIASGASGSGNGTVSYNVAANGTTSPRSATLTIAGQSFALTQAGGSCTFSVTPASATVPAAGVTGTIAVTVQNGCAWTATPSAAWITITGGGSGSKSGTIGYTVAANPSTSARSATIAVGSQLVTITQEAAPCSYSIVPASVKIGANATTGSVTVAAPAGCTWTATSGATWLAITGGASGSGNGTIGYSASANPGTGKRTASISVLGEAPAATLLSTASTLLSTVEQDGVPCSYGLSPATDSVPATGGNRTIGVTAQSGCAWTATPSASWITITAGGTDSGNGTISYAVAANPSTTGRTGTIAAGGQVVTITQPGAACSFGITPGSVSVDAAAATGTVAVATQASCGWTATSNASWITVTAGGAGTGTGTVAYSIVANAGTASRTGTVTIGGQTFRVTQAGLVCTNQIAPTGASVNASATTGTIAVTAATGCPWTAASQASWITVTGGASGTGAGTVSYSVAANPSTTPRTGTITAGGHTFTVTQAGVVCTFSVSPTITALSSDAANLTINVTTGGSCAWSASSSAPWMTLASGGSPGSGNAIFDVAANTTGASRSGTLTVAGQTVSVSQAAGTCWYTVSPILVDVGPNATTATAVVTTSAGCPWSASSPVPWATFPNGATGSGSGNLSIAVASNPEGVGRLTTLTIAGRGLVLNQAGRVCSYDLAPSAISVGADDTTGSFGVTASDGCSWTPTPSAPWITVSAGGIGNGSVTYAIAANTTGSQRSGSVAVGNRAFSITQFGPCSYSISPTDVQVGELASFGSVSVTAGPGCSWNAASAAPWITITGGASGAGGGTVSYSVAANPSSAPRSGTLNIAGNVFTVVQSSCGYAVTPENVMAGPGSQTNFALVRTGSSCGWTATSSSSWITIAAPASGTGVDWLTFNIAANGGSSTRTGQVTVAGQTIGVVQTGACTFTVAPQTQTVAAAGGTGTVTLTTGASCGWFAFSNTPWITINGGSGTGTGSATATFTVAPNTGSTPRTGTIQVGGITATITQSGANSLTTPKGLRIMGPD